MWWQPRDRTCSSCRRSGSFWNLHKVQHKCEQHLPHWSDAVRESEGVKDLGARRGRGGDRGDDAEGASGADGAEELLADAGEVHAAALDQEQGQEDERAGPGLEQLVAAAAEEG